MTFRNFLRSGQVDSTPHHSYHSWDWGREEEEGQGARREGLTPCHEARLCVYFQFECLAAHRATLCWLWTHSSIMMPRVCPLVLMAHTLPPALELCCSPWCRRSHSTDGNLCITRNSGWIKVPEGKTLMNRRWNKGFLIPPSQQALLMIVYTAS